MGISCEFVLYLQPDTAERKAFCLKVSDGAVAQLVEQWTENPCVGGSIPPHTTKNETLVGIILQGFFVGCLGETDRIFRDPIPRDRIPRNPYFFWVVSYGTDSHLMQ